MRDEVGMKYEHMGYGVQLATGSTTVWDMRFLCLVQYNTSRVRESRIELLARGVVEWSL